MCPAASLTTRLRWVKKERFTADHNCADPFADEGREGRLKLIRSACGRNDIVAIWDWKASCPPKAPAATSDCWWDLYQHLRRDPAKVIAVDVRVLGGGFKLEPGESI